MALINSSNLPTIQRIKYEDYKDAPSWFGQFLNTLNLFMTAVYNIVNRGITYSNLAVIAPIAFNYTPGTTTNFTINNPLSIAPNNVIVGNVYVAGNLSSHPAGPVTLFWHYTQGVIVVDSILGLTNGTTYVLSVMVS
jgi:hypothetical protein